MNVSILRYCSECGLPFIFLCDETEFRQQKNSREYLCQDCEGMPDRVPCPTCQGHGTIPNVNSTNTRQAVLRRYGYANLLT